MFNVVLCRALHPTAMAMLEARDDIALRVLTQDFRGPPLQKELASNIADADGVMVGLERVTDDLLATAPRAAGDQPVRGGVRHESTSPPQRGVGCWWAW